MVKYTGRGLVVKRPGVLSKVQILTLVLGVGVFSLFQIWASKSKRNATHIRTDNAELHVAWRGTTKGWSLGHGSKSGLESHRDGEWGAQILQIDPPHGSNWEPVGRLQGSLGPSGPETPEKSEKSLLGPPAPGPPKSLEKSRKSPESLEKSRKGPERLFRDFFQTLGGSGPRRLFSDFSGVSGEEGPRDPCKWPTVSQQLHAPRILVQMLSRPVLRDTARLSQRYPPIARYGVLGVSTWPIGCDTPSPFSERFPITEHSRSAGAISALKRGISAILARYLMKTRQKRAIPPSAILSRKGIARYGGVSRTGPLSADGIPLEASALKVEPLWGCCGFRTRPISKTKKLQLYVKTAPAVSKKAPIVSKKLPMATVSKEAQLYP